MLIETVLDEIAWEKAIETELMKLPALVLESMWVRFAIRGHIPINAECRRLDVKEWSQADLARELARILRQRGFMLSFAPKKAIPVSFTCALCGQLIDDGKPCECGAR